MSRFEVVKDRARNLLIYGGITAMTGAAMLGVGASAFAQDSTPAAGADQTTEAATDRQIRRAERQAERQAARAERQAARQAEYDAFLDELAANLGIADGATVDAAIRMTIKDRIDERLAAGEISADYAEAAKAAIDSGEYPIGLRLPGVGPMGGRDFHGDGGRGGFFGPGGEIDGVEDVRDADEVDGLTPITVTPSADGEVSV